MERRDLLRGGAIVAAVAIAGCSGEDDDGNGNGETDDTEGTGDETDDEGDDTGNGNGDAADGENATDETDEDDASDGEDGDEEEVGDEGDGNESDDADDAESEGNETDGDEDDEEGDGEDAGDGALFSDVVEFEESYAFETEGGEGADAVASSGRFHGGNTYMSVEESEGAVEMYTVEGETYIVEGEQCMVLPGMAEEEFDEEGVEDPEAEAEAQQDLQASGRDEIDGEEMYVFEISGEEADEHDEDVTYYVSVETGYVRRIEAGDSTTDFHSWGDVDPVEPPEMECMDFGDMNESDVPL